MPDRTTNSIAACLNTAQVITPGFTTVRRWFTASLICLFGLSNTQPLRANEFDEYQLKAAFLLRLSEFVDWHADVRSQEKFQLCIAAPEKTFRTFQQLNGRLIKGVPIEVVAKSDAEKVNCSLVFLGKKEKPANGLPFDCRITQGCLTVGETRGEVSHARTIIGLVRRADRVRVEINLEAAKEAGLMIDSDLLEVATIVEPAF